MTIVEFPKNRQNQDELLHYYNLVFLHGDSSVTSHASIRIGWPEQYVNEERIREAKRACGAPESAVPLVISYLGYMPRSLYNR